MIGLLAGLMAVAAIRPALIDSGAATPGSGLVAWNLFLFVIPLGLGASLLAGARWALMAAVIYGTIGLALDVSTIVQEVTRSGSRDIVVILSIATGLLNFFLILTGGRGFLHVDPDK
jgi:hypothetical protein